MALPEWAPRAISEGTKTIQLSAEGTIWETWSAPFKSAEEFVLQATAVVAAFAAECPKRRIPLTYTALDAQGTIVTQYPSSVIGLNKDADALAGSGGGAAKAFTEAMQGQAALMNTLLTSAKNFVEQVVKANESLTAQIVDLQEYKHAMMQAEVSAKESDSGMSELFLAQMKELMPQAGVAFQLFMDAQTAKAAKSSAAGAKTGIAAVQSLNGAPKS